MKQSILGILAAICFLLSISSNSSNAQIRILKRWELQGEVVSVQDEMIEVRDSNGKSLSLKIQGEDRDAIVLSGSGRRLRFPAEIQSVGTLSLDELNPGQVIQFRGRLSRRGRLESEVNSITVLDAVNAKLGVTSDPANVEANNEQALKLLTGEVGQIRRGRMTVIIPDSDLIRSGRLSVPVLDSTTIEFRGTRLASIKPGDEIKQLVAVELSSGDMAVEKLLVQIGTREADSATQQQNGLEARYRKFSDEPSPPRDVRSRNFLLHTDISDRQAQMLLDKLEQMFELIARYYAATPGKLIECYVVRDLRGWPEGVFDAQTATKISRGEGVTVSRRLGRNTQSIVFSCDDHGVVQHESVHAFCAQTFGSTGPTWYSEGMAEMGQYWQPGNLEVDINSFVISYIQRAEPKSLLEIVAAGQITGDSWQAYAWRWALCHLLANNPNYSDRFQALGIAMMKGQPASFETVYGDVAKEISFEYQQFLSQVGNGYRADLAAWQWGKRTVPLRLQRRVSANVNAAAGWQATGFQVEKDWVIEVETEGTWQLGKNGERLAAEGDASGAGRLVACVFSDYSISESFELGGKQSVTIPSSGDLFVRCRDRWISLGDNQGEIKLTVKRVNP